MLAVVGVDIGGTNTKIGIADKEGNLLGKSSFSTTGQGDEYGYIDNLKREIDQLTLKISPSKAIEIVGIGMGAPMANYYQGTIQGAVNLPWRNTIRICDLIEEKFDIPAVITNDANLAAIGEKKFGAAKNMKNFLSITLGTGLGCGIFIDDKLVHGEVDIAGELGHTSVKSNGRHCNCGNRGCLETYVSSNGLKRTVLKFMAQMLDDSTMRDISFNNLSAVTICELANKGDKIALKSLQYTGKILGYKLADVFALYNPEAVFITGGLANAKALIFEPTIVSIKNNIYKTYQSPIKVLPSALDEDEIGVLGGSAFIWDHLENNPKT